MQQCKYSDSLLLGGLFQNPVIRHYTSNRFLGETKKAAADEDTRKKWLKRIALGLGIAATVAFLGKQAYKATRPRGASPSLPMVPPTNSTPVNPNMLEEMKEKRRKQEEEYKRKAEEFEKTYKNKSII